MNTISPHKMIRIEQTDQSKETITYLKGYNIASLFLKKANKTETLQELHKKFKERGLAVPITILSQIKNKNLPHQYPTTIKRVLEYIGYENITISKKVLFTLDKPNKVTENMSLLKSGLSSRSDSSSKNQKGNEQFQRRSKPRPKSEQ